jgi:hypothetical protein
MERFGFTLPSGYNCSPDPAAAPRAAQGNERAAMQRMVVVRALVGLVAVARAAGKR